MRRTVLFLLVGVALSLGARPVLAVPVFARQYGTSCQTCHTVYPALTPFGEAFRRNGYRFPLGIDEDVSQDEPVRLGHEAHEEMWPEAIWPGQIPGFPPVALSIESGLVFARDEPAHAHGPVAPITHPTAENPWGVWLAPTKVGLLSAGTLGDVVSFFAKIELSTGERAELHVERPYLAFWPLRDARLGLRVGAFEPALHPVTMHRSLFGHDLVFTTAALGHNRWAPEPQQLGIEAVGVAWGRLGWTGGVVEGTGNLGNRAKDVYGRIEYKLGGLTLDGEGGIPGDQPWRERSLLTGAFAYQGFATFRDPGGGSRDMQSDLFRRVGADLTLVVDDGTLILAGFHQHHQRPIFRDPAPGTLTGGLAQVQWVTWPWLVPALRYEIFHQALPAGSAQMGHRAAVSLNALVRANVFLRFAGRGAGHMGHGFVFEEASVVAGAAF